MASGLVKAALGKHAAQGYVFEAQLTTSCVCADNTVFFTKRDRFRGRHPE